MPPDARFAGGRERHGTCVGTPDVLIGRRECGSRPARMRSLLLPARRHPREVLVPELLPAERAEPALVPFRLPVAALLPAAEGLLEYAPPPAWDRGLLVDLYC